MTKWLKETLADARQVLLAPLSNILCLLGGLVILASFADYDRTHGFALHGSPYWAMVMIGFCLILLGLAAFLTCQRDLTFHTRLNYAKGVVITRDTLTVLIKTLEIQAVPDSTRNTAIILPANTTFADDCVTDRRSALGAFFIEHFPDEIGALPECFRATLEESGVRADANGQYPAGTTVVLPDRFARPCLVAVTASTVRLPGSGISSSPHIVCSCVESIFRQTADRRIDTVVMPILGSGHGRIDPGLALLFLLLAILYNARVSSHIKKVVIAVHPKDVEALNRSKELRQIVAL
jgi:hypothetical protein